MAGETIIHHTFKITKFRMVEPEGTTEVSQYFGDNMDYYSWNLKAIIKFAKSRMYEISVHLNCIIRYKANAVCVCPKFSLLTSKNVLAEYIDQDKWFLFDSSGSQYLSRMEFSEQHKSISIFLTMQIVADNKLPMLSSEGRKNLTLTTLSQNFLSLYNDTESSDITIFCENREFNVHKVILIHRSPVFQAMFRNDMLEKSSNQVNIKDIDPEAFEVFLRFLYTGQASIEAKQAAGIYEACEKYQLPDLKEMCLIIMQENITVEACVETLLVADKFSLHDLRNKTLSFINKNIPKVINSPAWEKMTRSLMEALLVHKPN